MMMVELNACHNFSACIFICLSINLAEKRAIGNRFFARGANLFFNEDCHAQERGVALEENRLTPQEQR